jgi:hypothetical protein
VPVGQRHKCVAVAEHPASDRAPQAGQTRPARPDANVELAAGGGHEDRERRQRRLAAPGLVDADDALLDRCSRGALGLGQGRARASRSSSAAVGAATRALERIGDVCVRTVRGSVAQCP